MTELHQVLAERVAGWRADGYRQDRFPAIAEILGYAFVDGDARQLRYLRAAQFRALETYWYLRLVEGTPHVAELYERCFDRVTERLTALGLAAPELRDLATDEGYRGLIERIRTDDELARRHRLDALRETLALDYPSWILALAMGSGKTVLIGAIVATEFAMLARRLRTSNNLVLQAASRCLRQVPGNDRPARIYLSDSNLSALDRQLTETYGETLADVGGQRRVSKPNIIRLRKTDLPVIRIRMPQRSVVRAAAADGELTLRPPVGVGDGEITVSWLDVGLGAASRRVLRQVGDALTVDAAVDLIDPYAAAAHLAANYRLDVWHVLTAVRNAYPDGDVPVAHLPALAGQIEAWQGAWLESAHPVERELRIVHPDGFDTVTVDGQEVWQADISYPTDREHLVWGIDRVRDNPGDYGFHYVPYNFDSTPEADFYEKVLRELNLTPAEVQDVYFTGAITDPRKTDLSFAYPKRDGSEGRYTPDFVIYAAGDRWMLVEVKMTGRRADPVEGADGTKAAAIRKLAALDPDRIVYRMVFADQIVPAADVAAVRDFLSAG